MSHPISGGRRCVCVCGGGGVVHVCAPVRVRICSRSCEDDRGPFRAPQHASNNNLINILVKRYIMCDMLLQNTHGTTSTACTYNNVHCNTPALRLNGCPLTGRCPSGSMQHYTHCLQQVGHTAWSPISKVKIRFATRVLVT